MVEEVTVKQYRIRWIDKHGKPVYRYHKCPVFTGCNVGNLLSQGKTGLQVDRLEPKESK